jgi:two-component system, response regulator YesN
MYKLIIADDEADIRNGLASVMQWAKLGFEVVGVLSDGKDLISYLENNHADVILTDIVMTYQSGIDVARWVREHGRKTEIVFLSGFSEFKLAQQAMQYGVKQYLLKPTNLSEITKTFENIRKNLDEAYTQSQQIDRIQMHYCQLLFHQILFGMGDGNTINSFFASLNLKESPEHYLWGYFEVAFGNGTNVNATDDFIMSLCNSLNMPFERREKIFIPVKQSAKFLVMFCCSKADEDKRGESFVGTVKKSFVKFSKLFGAFAIDESFAVYEGFDEFIGAFTQIRVVDRSFEEKYRSAIQQTIADIKTMSIDQIIATIRSLGGSGEKSLYYVKQIGLMVIMQIKNDHQDFNSADLNDNGIYQYFFNETDEKKVVDFLIRVLNEFISHINGFAYAGNAIDKACLYIQAHIEDVAKIRLGDVAGHVFLNPAYFSRLFKEKMGVNFNEYVLDLRMNKAKELLAKTNLKIYDISEKLGYKDIRYFYKIFSSMAGMSPSQYRVKLELNRKSRSIDL